MKKNVYHVAIKKTIPHFLKCSIGLTVLLISHASLSAPGDLDDDGMPDIWEENFNLDPNDPNDAQWDWDLDGLTNLQEYQLGLDPMDPDSDRDDMLDGEEVSIGTDPQNQDSDQDQMPDGWEFRYGLNPLSADDAQGDLDLDGLANVNEYREGTDPTNVDSDGDTLFDGFEVANGMRPADADSDNDGLADNDEMNVYFTDPLLWDSDLNGIADGFDHGVIIQVSAEDLPALDRADGSGAAISRDGRYVAFVSASDTLVADDANGHFDVFWMDLATGERRLVSRAWDGGSANNWSGRNVNGIGLDISADGQKVVYYSRASNIVQNHSGINPNIFLYDALSDSNSVVNISSAGQLADGCWYPRISGDGRFVTFHSNSSVFLNGPDSNSYHSDVFLKDLNTGAVEHISKNSLGEQGNYGSEMASISDDGQVIVFQSRANNLVENDTNSTGHFDLFLYNRTTGTTTRVNVMEDGSEFSGSFYLTGGEVSGNGQYIAYATGTSVLTEDIDGGMDCYLFDVSNASTSMISNVSGPHDKCHTPRLSDSGRFVIYERLTGTFNSSAGIYVKDLHSQHVEVVSRRNGETQGASYSKGRGIALSGDGQFAQFALGAQLASEQATGHEVYVAKTHMPIESVAVELVSAQHTATGEPSNFQVNDGTYTLVATGHSLGGWVDHFDFIHGEFQGDVDVRVRLVSISNNWSTGGLVIRDTLEWSTGYAATIVEKENGGFFSRRYEQFTPSTNIDVPAILPGHWLRLQKSGDLFTSYYSVDGATWQLIGSDSITMGDSFYVGLGGTTVETSETTTFVFDSLSIQ